MARWIELGEGVFARRYEHLDQTLGLVVGAERCLVVDTGGDEVQGAEFAAIREISTLPWLVVLTHAHFDHHFGTKPFLPCPVWAHERCEAAMGADRDEWVETFHREHKHVLAERLVEAELVPPTHTLTAEVTLDLGGRIVTLLHPGPGHTDHDVAVDVPSAGVLFAGDLVEQGAPPEVGHPTDWPRAVDRLLARGPGTIVPGHGEPVDAAFVRRQLVRRS
ncbi:MBL fold metallo-hydrolase [Amycolatopsis sp. GM8]|uniref:MBL fold metallo-hydrolase n=1 Tax=Amycolatopsis sp. GM8 TaxID=2896530 RepID=UPI001F366F06|nr:MBL fold metallo-hydrolase [Amycolatopsis sp. GM8]